MCYNRVDKQGGRPKPTRTMQSLKELYRIGKGPSSSHTIGPERAARLFLRENPDADEYRVVLYGSLAKTGDGHGTEEILRCVLQRVTIENNAQETQLKHPNMMELSAYKNGENILTMVKKI